MTELGSDAGSAAAVWHDLTAGQMDFWEEFQFHPDQPVSTVAHVIAFNGVLDEAAMLSAIRQTVAEADTLALRFRETEDGRVQQMVDPARVPQVRQLDLRQEPDPEAAARRLMRADIDAPLDLRHAPLSAQMLLRLGERRWFWYSRGHHIILDGYSMSLIEKRVATLYAAALGQGAVGRPFDRLADFLREERDYAQSPPFQTDRSYWRDTLAPHRGDLPVLQKGAEDYGLVPLTADFAMGPDFDAALRDAAARLGVNWADLLTLLSAIWLSLLDPGRRPANGPVWLPYMSRMGSISANIPAMVVNILPLIVDPQPDELLPSLIGRLSRHFRRHRRHGRYRIEDMARDCGIPSGQRFHFTPLVNVMPFAPPRFHGLETERLVLAAGPGDGFNVSFTGAGSGSGLIASIEADPTIGATEFSGRVTAFRQWIGSVLQDLENAALVQSSADFAV